MEHSVIFKDPTHYASFPRVRRMRNGDLLLHYYDMPNEVHAQHPNLHHHYQLGSQVVVLRSKDEGQTWQRSLVDEWPGDWCQSDVIHFEPGEPYTEPPAPKWATACELEDGTVIHSVGGRLWSKDPEKLHLPSDIAGEPVEMSDGWHYVPVSGLAARCRFEGGRWEKEVLPLKVPPYLRPRWAWTYPQHMPDGSLVALMTGERPDLADSMQSREGVYFAAWSVDQGSTWEPLGIVAPAQFGTDPDRTWALCEANIAVTPSGTIVVVFRVEGANREVWRQEQWHWEGFVYQATSTSGGRTWAPTHKTPMWGHPAHLAALPDGRLVCVFGYRREPFGIQAVVSEDEGEKWDYANVRILRTDGVTRDLGYPNSVVLQDGRLLTVYYFTQADGIRHIAATVWSP